MKLSLGHFAAPTVSKSIAMAVKIGVLRVILLVVCAWTIYGFFFAIQGYLTSRYFGRDVAFSQNLAAWLSCALIWMLLTPVVYSMAWRFRFEKGRRVRSVIVHLLAGSCISVTTLSLFSIIRLPIDGRSISDFDVVRLQRLLVEEFLSYVLLYFILIGLYNVYDYYWRFRENQERAVQLGVEAAQLEARLAQAQLNALKMQIHPHFLFNTLNSISVLMPDDPIAANEMLVRLSELLRVALKTESSQLIPLREELDFLRDYLAIEQTRFQDRLVVNFEIDDRVLDATVPTLILQPIVENAIRHGIAPKPTAGVVQICAKRKNGIVELSVADNGSGISATSKPGGIGLRNTKERLQKLYGENQTLEVVTNKDEGVQVVIRLPYAEDEPQDPSFNCR